MSQISSPCILICSIDDKTGYCFGCGRTSEEIGDWATISEIERLDIMATLESRLATVVRRPRRETRRQKLARQRTQVDAISAASQEN